MRNKAWTHPTTGISHTHTHNHAEPKKPDLKIRSVPFFLYKVVDQAKQIYHDRCQNSGCFQGREWWDGGWEELAWEWGSFQGVMDVICVLIGVWVTQLCTFVDSLWTAYLRSVHFSICTFNLNHIKKINNEKPIQKWWLWIPYITDTDTHAHTLKPSSRKQGPFLSSET